MLKPRTKTMPQISNPQTVTFSPSWTFIPTHYCRNTCGYCAFVERDGAAGDLAPLSAALSEIKRAKLAGATELLIMSGEGVEGSRLLRARLDQWGFPLYMNYLIAVARIALAHDLLPHINVGNLAYSDLLKLKDVVPSMGMMLESTSAELRRSFAHRYAPDKDPERRIQTLRAAGQARMPFTTGLLIGIGETAKDREETLHQIASLHREFGHIQEVIIQPFTPHSKTKMAAEAAPGTLTMKRTIEAARSILPPDVAVQVPPNIATDFVEYVKAGARDFGGISPDGDRINPEEPWHVPLHYCEALEEYGFKLIPRLAVYDQFLTPEWLPGPLIEAALRVRQRLSEEIINHPTSLHAPTRFAL
ncbi:MAG: 7,8-didemethyl-8-hydroxy-5-deazariboflavin synthase subunit CofG [Pyrinomonadaceae bacterium]